MAFLSRRLSISRGVLNQGQSGSVRRSVLRSRPHSDLHGRRPLERLGADRQARQRRLADGRGSRKAPAQTPRRAARLLPYAEGHRGVPESPARRIHASRDPAYCRHAGPRGGVAQAHPQLRRWLWEAAEQPRGEREASPKAERAPSRPGRSCLSAALRCERRGAEAILLVAFDTGMRQREILDLRWEQVDLRQGVIRLAPQDTKGEEPRLVVLTKRVRDVLKALPRGLPTTPLFRNPRTGEAWQDIRKAFRRARKAAGLDGIWIHDLRRSFVTRTRRPGVPESVVMRMSGHRTRAVFDRYNIVSEDDLHDAVARIEAEN